MWYNLSLHFAVPLKHSQFYICCSTSAYHYNITHLSERSSLRVGLLERPLGPLLVAVEHVRGLGVVAEPGLHGAQLQLVLGDVRLGGMKNVNQLQ